LENETGHWTYFIWIIQIELFPLISNSRHVTGIKRLIGFIKMVKDRCYKNAVTLTKNILKC